MKDRNNVTAIITDFVEKQIFMHRDIFLSTTEFRDIKTNVFIDVYLVEVLEYFMKKALKSIILLLLKFDITKLILWYMYNRGNFYLFKFKLL